MFIIIQIINLIVVGSESNSYVCFFIAILDVQLLSLLLLYFIIIIVVVIVVCVL